MRYQVLTTEQAEQFVERGYIAMRGCFSREAAREYTSTLWTRLGYSPDDPVTWAEPSIHMPSHRSIDIRTFAPKAWGAVCDLLGGQQRWAWTAMSSPRPANASNWSPTAWPCSSP